MTARWRPRCPGVRHRLGSSWRALVFSTEDASSSSSSSSPQPARGPPHRGQGAAPTQWGWGCLPSVLIAPARRRSFLDEGAPCSGRSSSFCALRPVLILLRVPDCACLVSPARLAAFAARGCWPDSSASSCSRAPPPGRRTPPRAWCPRASSPDVTILRFEGRRDAPLRPAQSRRADRARRRREPRQRGRCRAAPPMPDRATGERGRRPGSPRCGRASTRPAPR